MASDFGLQFRNVDNRVFEVTLPGQGNEDFGILTHADVVPVVADEWVLDDGTRLDPFKLTRVGDYLYGRGTIDDKGSIAAVLYAMKTVKESGVPLRAHDPADDRDHRGNRRRRHEVLPEHTTLPDYNIVLDSKYPAVVAEKGSGALKVLFPVQAGEGAHRHHGDEPVPPRPIPCPQTATARLKGGDPAAWRPRSKASRDPFIRKYEAAGGKFSIDIGPGPDGVEVKVTGTSAHGSRPEEGVNPLPRLALFLQESGVALADNHYAEGREVPERPVRHRLPGREDGRGLQRRLHGPADAVAQPDPRARRQAGGDHQRAHAARQHAGGAHGTASPGAINAWAAANQATVEIDYEQGNWMARDPKGAWLSTLLNIFGDTTGLEAKPVPTAGSTTAKLMPNAINFGPAMPGKKYTAHNAKEYKEVADLDADMQMFTEMLVRIGNLETMQ